MSINYTPLNFYGGPKQAIINLTPTEAVKFCTADDLNNISTTFNILINTLSTFLDPEISGIIQSYNYFKIPQIQYLSAAIDHNHNDFTITTNNINYISRSNR